MPAALIRRQNKRVAKFNTSKRSSGYFHLSDAFLLGGGAFLVLCAGAATGIIGPTIVGKVAAICALVIGIALALMRSAPFILTVLFAFAHGATWGWFAKNLLMDDVDAAQAIIATFSVMAAYFIVFFPLHKTTSFLARMAILFVTGAVIHLLLHYAFVFSGGYFYVRAAFTLPFSVFSLVALLLLSFILTRDSFAIEEVEQAQRRREVAPMIAYSLMLAPSWILITIVRLFIYIFNNSGDIPGPYND